MLALCSDAIAQIQDMYAAQGLDFVKIKLEAVGSAPPQTSPGSALGAAQNIINNAPEASGISGWKLFDGLRNRYWLNENLVNNRYNIIHDVIYSYYRSGLDKMYDNETEGRSNLLQSLTQLQAFNQENANTMFLQFFMQNKTTELIGIFKKGTVSDKAKAVDLLTKLDVANNQRYKDELK